MKQETPKLREVAEQMIADGALLLRVNEDLLESGYLLATAHGDDTASVQQLHATLSTVPSRQYK